MMQLIELNLLRFKTEPVFNNLAIKSSASFSWQLSISKFLSYGGCSGFKVKQFKKMWNPTLRKIKNKKERYDNLYTDDKTLICVERWKKSNYTSTCCCFFQELNSWLLWSWTAWLIMRLWYYLLVVSLVEKTNLNNFLVFVYRDN